MEDFKRPSLPVTQSTKTEKESLKGVEEDIEICKDTGVTKKPSNPYKVPVWSGSASKEINYSFEVLKCGQIIDEIKELQSKPYWSFGRLPQNDIEMAHPTISRFHAILQFRPKYSCAQSSNDEEVAKSQPPEGWYIYDLGSTHGTFLNKQRIPPNVYIRIRVGHLLKLGASTRSYILQGPSDDKEPESKLSITEIKAKRQQELEEAALEKKHLAEEIVDTAKNEGCSWGMAEDADEEADLTHNPYATTNNEELFLDDPKKTLRGYFEREGIELVYKCDEMSAGSFVCRVELPVDDANGRSVIAEVVHKGKKKDCVVQCALEACRILDRYGVLRQANQEPLKRKQKSQESDSDDDEFLDRTGDIAKKKKRKAAANASITYTYEGLLQQESDIEKQIKDLETQIVVYQKQQQRLKARKSEEGEDLDAFMKNLHDEEIKYDKTEIRKLRLEEQRLIKEKHKIQKLKKIAKPVEIPISLQGADRKPDLKIALSSKKQLPMIGKRNQFSKFKIFKVQPTKERKPENFVDSNDEEVEMDEDELKVDESNQRKESLSNQNLLMKNDVDDQVADSFEEKKITEALNKIDTDEGTLLDSKSCSKQASECNIKKRRHRVRQRNKREDVDINDADYESSEKYAKWLPPENQTGDGLTELNKKFGY